MRRPPAGNREEDVVAVHEIRLNALRHRVREKKAFTKLEKVAEHCAKQQATSWKWKLFETVEMKPPS